jgi:predicted nuclease of predicted toxin-antitoxin system
LIRLLLDENISPTLVRRLAELGIFAQSVPHVGLAGAPDDAVWAYAAANDLVVVTANVRDFLTLAKSDIHAGLIVLLEGELNSLEQFERLEPVVRFVEASTDPDFLLNRVIEVRGPIDFRILEILP